MSFLSPWSLWWLLSLPLLVTFYLFRPEPQRRLLTTFFLWKKAVPESQGGVYAKQLRSNPLLWLQLLALLLLSLYLARPATSWLSALPTGSRVVLVIDTSASMNAGGAFEQAVAKARQAIDGLFGLSNLSSSPEVMLIAVDREPRILVPFTRDQAQLRSALDALSAGEVPDRLESIRPFLATLITDRKASVWLFGDHLPEELELPGLQFSRCGSSPAGNVALSAFSVENESKAGNPKPLLYARVENFSRNAEQRILRIETMDLSSPDKPDATVFEQVVTLPAGEGRTVSQTFPASRLSTDQPTLFRASLRTLPGAVADGFVNDDTAYVCSPPFGGDRLSVAITPELQAGFLLRALMAHPNVEVLDWKALTMSPGERPLDLLVSSRDFRPPSRPTVRTRMLVTEAAPAKDAPVEVLRATPGQPLVADAGVEWERLRVQRDPAWPSAPGEQVLLSTDSGPALTLSGMNSGQPTLAWRFPLGYSSLPLSPALPILTGRFLREYARPAAQALPGSLSTEERHQRPAGRSWAGPLEIQPRSGNARQGPPSIIADPSDGQLPRLTRSGFYQARTSDDSKPWIAVNIFSPSESALPQTVTDRSFAAAEGTAGPTSGATQRHYRDFSRPLAALALMILFFESWLFLRRGRP